MAKKTAIELSRLIDQMQQERQEHLDAIAEIDAIFDGIGIEASAPAKKKKGRRGRPPKRKAGRKPGRKPGRKKRVGRPPKAKKAAKKKVAKKAAKKRTKRRKKGSFSKTGDQSVLDFVKKTGKVSAKQANKHWKDEGRKGSANNALTKLVKEKKLKRVPVKGQRGGLYQAA